MDLQRFEYINDLRVLGILSTNAKKVEGFVQRLGKKILKDTD